MRTLMIGMTALALVMGACGGDDDDTNQNQNNNQTQGDAAVQGDTGVTPDAAPDGGSGNDQGIGADCECTDSSCEQGGVPKPNGSPIVGCDDVPSQTGADLVCLRSYSGDLATDTFFANGYCALMATTCTGASLICNNAVFGDFANLTTCPAGTVMLQDTQDVDVFGMQATIENKVCVKACTGAGQCREGETDPALQDETTQYACIDKGGVKFCYDPRNLSASYTATQF